MNFDFNNKYKNQHNFFLKVGYKYWLLAIILKFKNVKLPYACWCWKYFYGYQSTWPNFVNSFNFDSSSNFWWFKYKPELFHFNGSRLELTKNDHASFESVSVNRKSRYSYTKNSDYRGVRFQSLFLFKILALLREWVSKPVPVKKMN